MRQILKLTKNKWFLYFVFAISFLNVIDFLQQQQFNYVLLTVAISVIIQHFTINMIYILGIPLLLVRLYLFLQLRVEGLEDEDIDDEDEDEEEEERNFDIIL